MSAMIKPDWVSNSPYPFGGKGYTEKKLHWKFMTLKKITPEIFDTKNSLGNYWHWKNSPGNFTIPKKKHQK